jgi:hypothetical protein
MFFLYKVGSNFNTAPRIPQSNVSVMLMGNIPCCVGYGIFQTSRGGLVLG